MNTSNDKIIDRIESAQRMLGQARTEHHRGNAEDAATFLEVAVTRIKSAIDAIKSASPVSVNMVLNGEGVRTEVFQLPTKGTAHAR